MWNLITLSLFSGLFAGISSCVLPLYPVMLNYLSRTRESKKLIVLSFVLGLFLTFILFYVIIAVIISRFGPEIVEWIDSKRGIFYLIAALITMLFALQSLGKIVFFTRTISLLKFSQHTSVPGSFVTGIFFATIISPCNAPFLITGILPILVSANSTLNGVFLISIFSVAMSLPLLILGFLSAHAMEFMDILNRNMRKIETLSGIFLIGVALYFIYLAFPEIFIF